MAQALKPTEESEAIRNDPEIIAWRQRNKPPLKYQPPPPRHVGRRAMSF
jgi:hypothetical protein